MRDVFLSYHYDEPNTRIARQIQDLLESHRLRATTGDTLGGGTLTEAIKRQINEADALIALLTRNQRLANGSWTTHEYVRTELQHARGAEKPAIALVEQGVDVSGLYKENEFIPYAPADALPAFLKLSRTIWSWKNRSGYLSRPIDRTDVQWLLSKITSQDRGIQFTYLRRKLELEADELEQMQHKRKHLLRPESTRGVGGYRKRTRIYI